MSLCKNTLTMVLWLCFCLSLFPPSVGAKPSLASKASDPMGPTVRQVQRLFPSGTYQRLNRVTDLDKCPPTGAFVWHSLGAGDWIFEMSVHQAFRFSEKRLKGRPLLAGPPPPKGACKDYKHYHYLPAQKKVAIQSTYLCQGRPSLVTSRELVRTQNGLIYTFYEQKKKGKKPLYQCRYRLR